MPALRVVNSRVEVGLARLAIVGGDVLHREVVGGQNHVRLAALYQVPQHLVHVEVRAHSGAPDLAGLLCRSLEIQ